METKKTKLYTLCIIHQHPRVLLAMKKRGFGMGKWNGYGGKVHPQESIEAAAHRELLEESGLTVRDLKKIGVNRFEFRGNPEILEVHVFKATEYAGEPVETEEMRPQWFTVDTIPFGEMWKDDPHWIGHFFDGRKFNGYFLFDESGDAVLTSTVEVE